MAKDPLDKESSKGCKKKGLMYMNVKINNKSIRVMINTSDMHNYLTTIVVERFGLALKMGLAK